MIVDNWCWRDVASLLSAVVCWIKKDGVQWVISLQSLTLLNSNRKDNGPGKPGPIVFRSSLVTG